MPKKSDKKKPIKNISLSNLLGKVGKSAKAIADAGAPVGACLVTNPHTGERFCVETDEATCKFMKGKFVGGPCGLG